MPLRHELGVDILVVVDLLSRKEAVLVEPVIRWRHTAGPASRDAACGDVHQPGPVRFTPGREVADGAYVHPFDLVAFGKVLDTGGAVDHRHARRRRPEVLQHGFVCPVPFNHGDPGAEERSGIIAEVGA